MVAINVSRFIRFISFIMIREARTAGAARSAGVVSWQWKWDVARDVRGLESSE